MSLLNRSQSQIQETRTALRKIINAESVGLRVAVASEALDWWSDYPAQMFHDLATFGCQNGTINSLIYYKDTHEFFDRFYDDIEVLREDYEYSFGEPINIRGDLKNWLAWYAFEETASLMAHNELELDF